MSAAVAGQPGALLPVAEKYLAAGFSVLPVKADGSKAPAASTWKEFQARQPTPDELRAAFGNGARVGIALVHGAISGNSEVLDFDAPGLFEEYAALCADHDLADLLATLPLIETPSGGRHLLYRCEAPVEGNQKLARDKGGAARIETRGEGGYTLAPGSPAACHPDNRPYLRVPGSGALSAVPVIAPDERHALLALARAFNEYADPATIHRPKTKESERTPDSGLRPGDDFNERGDPLPLLEAAGWQVAGQRGETILLRRPGKTGRGISATYNFGGSRVFFPFTTSAAHFEAETSYPPFSVYGLLKHGGNFEAAARALRGEGFGDQTPPAVKRALRAVAADEPETEAAPPPLSDTDAPPAENPRLPTFHLTDDGNGLRLVHRHGQDLRYCYAWGKWLVWDGRRWKKDDGDAIEMRAKDTARALLKEAADCADANEQKTLVGHALKMQAFARIQAMIALARSEVPTRSEEWDTGHWLLNCPNGTVDLRTGRLRPHERADRITRLAGTEYDPAATAPTWEAFLARVLPDADVRAFVRRAAGYALTGDVSEQCLFFLYGHGSNGKSTLLRAVMGALGDYALQAAPDLLIAKDSAGGGPNNDVAELQGARFVATVEVEDGKRMAEGLVKQITGGDVVKARFMRQDFFAFEPTHKIFLAANHKPTIRGNDFAIWRRIKVLPFEVQIADAEKDPHLPDKLRAELPGILAWAVRGCQEWQRGGLGEPEAVTAATSEYRDEQDALRDFLADCCVIRPSLSVTAAGLFKTYNDWCDQNGDRALGKKGFTQRLREQKGVEPAAKVPPTWARGWVGIGLRADRQEVVSDTSDTSDVKSPISSLYPTPRVDIGKNTSEVSEVSEASEASAEAVFDALDTSDLTDPFASDDADDADVPSEEVAEPEGLDL